MEYGVVALWTAMYLLLAAATTPLAAYAFPRFPDRGAALAFPLSFLALFVPVYWVGQVAFGPLTALLGVLSLAGLSALAVRRGVAVDRRGYAEAAGVFLAAFGFLLLIRVGDPGAFAGGGEKFLDFGLLQSLLRADRLPPEDMWFAGERVQYYYGGHLLAATLAELTGTAGRFAYNPALAGFYAVEVVAVYGIGTAIADSRGLPARTAGALSAFCFGLAGNLFAPFRLLLDFFPDGFVGWVAASSDLNWESVAISVSEFSYWDPSRVIPGMITEFPLFAFLNGDLHGHMLSPAPLLVVVACAFAYYRTPRGRRSRRVGLLALAALATGMVTATNTWSSPTALGVLGVALTFAPAPAWSLLPDRAAARIDALPRWVREGLRPVGATLIAGAVAVPAIASVAPFVPNVLLASAGQRHIAFLPERAGTVALLLVHGGFVAVFARYLADRAASKRAVALAALAAALLLACGVAFNLAGVAVFGPLLAGGWYLLRRGRVGFETVLVVAGAGLLLLVEFVYLKDFAASGRTNTVFKTYFQAWTLWSLGGGVALVAVVRNAPSPVFPSFTPETRRRVRAVGVAALLCTLSVYGAFAVGNHLGHANPEPTLDATEFVETYHPEEAEAISWLNEREGRPHIAAAPTHEVYSWGNPASSLTGIPTVVGWAHERIYRGAEAYERRVDDVELLFTGSTATRAAMIRKYDVRYIYYGPAEKKRYGEVSIGADPGVRVAHQSGNVTIYGVNRSALSG